MTPTEARVRGVATRLRARHYQGITREEDRLLVEAYQMGIGRDLAIGALLEAHKGLGMAIAKRYARPDQIEDCLLEAELGIAAAAERFDLSRNIKFATYATYQIVNRVRRYCVANNWGIRVPEYAAYRTFRVLRMLKANPEATDAQIAESLDLTIPAVEDSRRIIKTEMISLDDTYNPGGIAPADYLEDETLDLLGGMIAEHESKAIAAAIKRLRPTHQRAIMLRFGFDGDDPRTYEQMAELRGVSRQAACDAVLRALERLRKELTDETP